MIKLHKDVTPVIESSASISTRTTLLNLMPQDYSRLRQERRRASLMAWSVYLAWNHNDGFTFHSATECQGQYSTKARCRWECRYARYWRWTNSARSVKMRLVRSSIFVSRELGIDETNRHHHSSTVKFIPTTPASHSAFSPWTCAKKTFIFQMRRIKRV